MPALFWPDSSPYRFPPCRPFFVVQTGLGRRFNRAMRRPWQNNFWQVIGRRALAAAGCGGLVLAALAQTNAPPPDRWLEGEAAFPGDFARARPNLSAFSSLQAEILVGKLKLYWTPASMDTNAQVTALASFDAPGHWPARDWRRFLMQPRGTRWEGSLPVEHTGVPVVYFVEARRAQATDVSPLRVCRPDALGLEAPSRVPWPFLEGFEQGAESWRLEGDETLLPPLEVRAPGHDSNHALTVRLPPGKHSITITTTRPRGWQILQHSALGLRLWLRATPATGRARFTIFANARTETQTSVVFPEEPALEGDWREVELLFDPLSRLPLAETDLLAIEFIGVGPAEFQVDNLEWITRGDARSTPKARDRPRP